MEISSALLALCAENSPVTGEFPAQRRVTLSFDVFFDLHLNKRLSKKTWGWWFETPSRSLWHHYNVFHTQNNELINHHNVGLHTLTIFTWFWWWHHQNQVNIVSVWRPTLWWLMSNSLWAIVTWVPEEWYLTHWISISSTVLFAAGHSRIYHTFVLWWCNNASLIWVIICLVNGTKHFLRKS